MTPKQTATRVARAQSKLDAARVERDRALFEGREAGLSLRALAGATGIGVESVRRILNGATS
jgi:hypothetical protein